MKHGTWLLGLGKLAGLALTVVCWIWASNAERSEMWNVAIVWCAPLLQYPIAFLGRRTLDARPDTGRVEWLTTVVHYAIMIALGVAIVAAIGLVQRSPGAGIPIPRPVSLAIVYLTGFAALLTVVNLAVRGLGAPFAAKLSSRLATDWMYAWTRNPMGFCTMLWLLSLGLYFRSFWFLAWVAVSVSPGWILWVKIYEERELEIRFGAGYLEYRKRTPMLWPRRPVMRER